MPLRLRRHSIVVMSELVQEDVEQRVGPNRRFGPLGGSEILRAPRFHALLGDPPFEAPLRDTGDQSWSIRRQPAHDILHDLKRLGLFVHIERSA